VTEAKKQNIETNYKRKNTVKLIKRIDDGTEIQQKEVKIWREKRYGYHDLQPDNQTSEREEEEKEEEETDQNLPVIVAPKLSSFAQLKKQTNKHTNAPSVPEERRDSREIVAAEQLMNRTKEEECCGDGRIYHNLVLLSS
jgi:hypothetical protein